MERKPGIKTTEHWLGVASTALLGFVGAESTAWQVQATAVAAVAVIMATYIWSRTKAKAA